jgi:ABC-type lipoprotein release transport system permease subunit
VLAASPSPSPAHAAGTRIVGGRVLDDATSQPLVNATVAVWDTVRATAYQWRLVATAWTDGAGEFTATVSDGSPYRVYAYSDDAGSPGFDYVPAFADLTRSDANVSLTFRLLPAASLLVEGNLWFVESTKPADSFSFLVVEDAADPSPGWGYVASYGTAPPIHAFLNTSSSHVIVPVERGIHLEVNASVMISNDRLSKHFVIDDLEGFTLRQGDVARIDVGQYTSPVNYAVVDGLVATTTQRLSELDEKGFYTVAENEDLARVTSLLALAHTKIEDASYSSAYTDLRESYVATTVLHERLDATYANAIGSVAVLTGFLAVTAVTLSLLLFERPSSKYAMYLLFFAGIFALFYAVYPGTRLLPPLTLVAYVATALGGVAVLTLLLPKIVNDKLVSTFSISKRNLRRRRNRFLLTAVTILLLVMSFVSLTSFSTGYGFTTTRQAPPQTQLLGHLLARELQPAASTAIFAFVPLSPATIDVLRDRPQVVAAASKAESQPQLGALGSLSVPSTAQRTSIYGVIGIQPSAEASLTGFDDLVVAGRYLRDDDVYAVLISDDLAETLGVAVNSTVHLLYRTAVQATVVGVFDADRFRQAKDVDGKDFAPSRLRLIDPETPPVKGVCEPNEVLIMTVADATTLYGVPLSRVNLLLAAPADAAAVAKALALEQGLAVWYSDGVGLYEAAVAPFFEERGAFIFIPWIIVILNVLMTMLNSIFEYRKEVATLSAIGLNPTDITGLFIAEAAVIGFVGGGLGYLLGLSNYKVMAMLAIVVEVRPKISAAWSVAALLISISAVLVGALAALKYSVDITPSTLRRWTIETTPAMGTPWAFTVPFRVPTDRVDDLFESVATRFREHLYSRSINPEEGQIRFSREDTPDASTRIMDFHYLLGFRSNVGSLPFQLVAKKGVQEATYSFEVFCKGAEETVKDTVSFLRMAIIEWSSQQTRD